MLLSLEKVSKVIFPSVGNGALIYMYKHSYSEVNAIWLLDTKKFSLCINQICHVFSHSDWACPRHVGTENQQCAGSKHDPVRGSIRPLPAERWRGHRLLYGFGCTLSGCQSLKPCLGLSLTPPSRHTFAMCLVWMLLLPWCCAFHRDMDSGIAKPKQMGTSLARPVAHIQVVLQKNSNYFTVYTLHIMWPSKTRKSRKNEYL